RIKNMNLAIGCIRQPQLTFVRREADAVARASVTFLTTWFGPGDLHPMHHLARSKVPDLEPQQLVYVHKTERLHPVYRKRPDHVAEWTHGQAHLSRVRIHHCQNR